MRVASLNGQYSAFTRQLRDIKDRMNYHKFPQQLQVSQTSVCLLVHTVVAEFLLLVLQDRVAEYFTRQWDEHHILVGEDSLGFTNSLSAPLKSEVDLFMVICDCASYRHSGTQHCDAVSLRTATL